MESFDKELDDSPNLLSFNMVFRTMENASLEATILSIVYNGIIQD